MRETVKRILRSPECCVGSAENEQRNQRPHQNDCGSRERVQKEREQRFSLRQGEQRGEGRHDRPAEGIPDHEDAKRGDFEAGRGNKHRSDDCGGRAAREAINDDEAFLRARAFVFRRVRGRDGRLIRGFAYAERSVADGAHAAHDCPAIPVQQDDRDRDGKRDRIEKIGR